MAKHKCLTPGSNYHFKIHKNEISVRVTLPKDVHKTVDELSYREAKKLENDLHDAVEKILSRLFDKSSIKEDLTFIWNKKKNKTN